MNFPAQKIQTIFVFNGMFNEKHDFEIKRFDLENIKYKTNTTNTT